jgi:hypothetical protein
MRGWPMKATWCETPAMTDTPIYDAVVLELGPPPLTVRPVIVDTLYPLERPADD